MAQFSQWKRIYSTDVACRCRHIYIIQYALKQLTFCHFFSHFSWHSIWRIFWHSCWQSSGIWADIYSEISSGILSDMLYIWLFIWHSVSNVTWNTFWHPPFTWHSIWHFASNRVRFRRASKGLGPAWYRAAQNAGELAMKWQSGCVKDAGQTAMIC